MEKWNFLIWWIINFSLSSSPRSWVPHINLKTWRSMRESNTCSWAVSKRLSISHCCCDSAKDAGSQTRVWKVVSTSEFHHIEHLRSFRLPLMSWNILRLLRLSRILQMEISTELLESPQSLLRLPWISSFVTCLLLLPEPFWFQIFSESNRDKNEAASVFEATKKIFSTGCKSSTEWRTRPHQSRRDSSPYGTKSTSDTKLSSRT